MKALPFPRRHAARRTASLLVLLLCVVPAAVHAEDASASARTAQSEAWGLYEQAFSDAAAGREDVALLALEELSRRFPETGAALLGEELRRLVTGRAAGSAAPPSSALRARLEHLAPPEPGAAPSVASSTAARKPYGSLAEALRDEQPNNGSRAELVLGQTLHGIVLGLEGCTATVNCSAQGVAASAVLGAAAGAGLSLLYSGNGVTAGQALAINSGTAWGAWNTGLILATVPNAWSSNTAAGVLALGQVVGTVAGHFAWAGLGLSAGDLSLMNSAGLYAGAATLLVYGATGANLLSSSAFALVMLAATDAGLVVGYLVSRHTPLGRGRVLVMDAGAVLGGLLGAAVVFLVSGNGQATAAAALIGAGGGVVASLHITRNWDLEWAGLPVQVGLAPTQHGGGQLAVMGRF